MAQFGRLVAIIFMVSSLPAFAQQPQTPIQKQQAEQARIEAETQKEIALRIANIYKAQESVNGLIEWVCNSVKISLDLTNSNACRMAAAEFIASRPLPYDDGLALKVYKLELAQAIVNAKYRDQKDADPYSFYNRSQQDTLTETKEVLVGAILKSMGLAGRADCSGKDDTLACRLNIIEDVKQTTFLQLAVAQRAREQAEIMQAQADEEAKERLVALKKIRAQRKQNPQTK